LESDRTLCVLRKEGSIRWEQMQTRFERVFFSLLMAGLLQISVRPDSSVEQGRNIHISSPPAVYSGFFSWWWQMIKERII
jgi:hypothetical protein